MATVLPIRRNCSAGSSFSSRYCGGSLRDLFPRAPASGIPATSAAVAPHRASVGNGGGAIGQSTTTARRPYVGCELTLTVRPRSGTVVVLPRTAGAYRRSGAHPQRKAHPPVLGTIAR